MITTKLGSSEERDGTGSLRVDILKGGLPYSHPKIQVHDHPLPHTSIEWPLPPVPENLLPYNLHSPLPPFDLFPSQGSTPAGFKFDGWKSSLLALGGEHNRISIQKACSELVNHATNITSTWPPWHSASPRDRKSNEWHRFLPGTYSDGHRTRKTKEHSGAMGSFKGSPKIMWGDRVSQGPFQIQEWHLRRVYICLTTVLGLFHHGYFDLVIYI